MFCYGADGDTPELRAPSLKGALRFWWRAIHPNLDELKKEETELFGGAADEEAKKSSFSILISNISKSTKEIQALPHKTLFKKECIMPDSTFDLIIRPKNEKIKKLLILTSILGGIGARSRRGFGCFQIEKINEEDFNFDLNKNRIIDLIKDINPDFQFEKNYSRNYPYLQKVEIGKPTKDYNELLKKIGQASSDYYTDYTGFAGGKNRYASPIYVSVYKQNDEFYPIISTLKRTIQVGNHQDEEKKKNNFIKAILGGE